MINGLYQPVSYAGDGAQTAFPITFEFVSSDDIRALARVNGLDTTLTPGVDFTVSGTALTTVTAPAVGATLIIYMEMPFTQKTDYRNTGKLNLEVLESSLDKAALTSQELRDQVSRSVKLPVGSTADPDTYMAELHKAVSGAAASQTAAAASATAAAASQTAAAVSATDAAASAADAAASAVEAQAAVGSVADRTLSNLISNADALANLGIFGAQLTSAVSIHGVATLDSTAFGKLHQCSGTSEDYTVTLPTVSGNAGKIIGVSMVPGLTKIVTVTGNGSELIDGSNTRVMWAGESAILYCDGASWTKVGGKTRPMTVSMSSFGGSSTSVDTSTLTKIALGATLTAQCPVAMYGTIPSGIIIVRSGIYKLGHGVRFNSVSAAGAIQVYPLKQGGVVTSYTQRYITTADNFPTLHDSAFLPCVVGDTFELYSRQFTGSTQTAYAHYDTRLTLEEVPSW